MDKRIAQNGINFILSERFTFSGTDFIPLAEFVRELQAELINVSTQDTQGGHTEGPAPGP